MGGVRDSRVPVDDLSVAAYTIPTEEPESDGTLTWASHTVVVVQVAGGGRSGLGYSYTSAGAARVIEDQLREVVLGADALMVRRTWDAMAAAVRNLGRPGIASGAIAAVDIALWDLQARLLDRPLALVLGPRRERVRVYGSGGFTSYSDAKLQEQMAAWVADGLAMVKMKVGRDQAGDPRRVGLVRDTIGPDIGLFVDANAGYTRKQALAMAEPFAEHGVTWFEEPVASDDVEGLRLLRDRCPPGMDVAAGEYACTLQDFRRLLQAQAVDVLQVDAVRCGGYTGMLAAGALCEAFSLPLSTHTAPAIHLPAACVPATLAHMEYFHDHVRIEHLLFEGVPRPVDGRLAPDLSRPGHGLELRRRDAERYAVAA